MESTQPCPNCTKLVSVNATICTHCGAALPGRDPAAVWPPPLEPGAPAAPVAPVPRLVTKTAWGDVTLGVVIALVSMFVGGLGILVMPVLYFVLRPGTPVFARGIGYGFLAAMALLLGAFALCLYSVGRGAPG